MKNYNIFKRQSLSFGLMFMLTLGGLVSAVAASNEGMKEDKTHVNKWNLFTKNMYKLHKKLVTGKKINIKTRVGGYSDTPKFYKEETYYNAQSGKKISMIQWEIKNPKNIHTIEVLVRNKKGQVIRDYSAAYLPHYRNAPSQTLINLWGHTGKMHGFRQFDAGGDLIYEQCEGTWKGKKVMLRLFEDDLVNGDDSVQKSMKSEQYKACFRGVAATAKKYLVPN